MGRKNLKFYVDSNGVGQHQYINPDEIFGPGRWSIQNINGIDFARAIPVPGQPVVTPPTDAQLHKQEADKVSIQNTGKPHPVTLEQMNQHLPQAQPTDGPAKFSFNPRTREMEESSLLAYQQALRNQQQAQPQQQAPIYINQMQLPQISLAHMNPYIRALMQEPSEVIKHVPVRRKKTVTEKVLKYFEPEQFNPQFYPEEQE